MKNLCLAFLSAFAWPSLALQTVSYVDPARYLGTWYQIARNPHPFEAGCECSRQVLSDEGHGVIGVYNSCNNGAPGGPLREIRGTATNDDPATNARFTVDFGLPRKGQYWIIGLDPDYRWAVVSEPSLQTLYILSKTPGLPDDLYQLALAEAARQVDASRLTRYSHATCTYPPPVNSPGAGLSADRSLPSPPADPRHPGSKVYKYSSETRQATCSGRNVKIVMPVSSNSIETFPAVIFGHGQALDFAHYAATFEHLAKKGVAAIYPEYDNGFFDQDWPRMARDYVNLAECALARAGGRVNPEQLVFSGHSKGAYVASIAAGLAVKENLPLRAGAIMLFATAGFDSTSAAYIEPQTTTTVVYGDQDTVVEKRLSESFFSAVSSRYKQFIMVQSYGPNSGRADHYFPQTKGAFFGGGGESALHYFGMWKWLVGAAHDLRDGAPVVNSYVYGSDAADKGNGAFDLISRNW